MPNHRPNTMSRDELAALPVRERDELTLAAIDEARRSCQEAMRLMPNHVDSAFTAGDARRLAALERGLGMVELVRSDLERVHGGR